MENKLMDKDFAVFANHIQETHQAQLDVSRRCCDFGLTCCQGLADLSGDATRGALALGEAVREHFLHDILSEFVTESSGTGLSYWSAWWWAVAAGRRGASMNEATE
ncbi:hypothetical protein [Aromatoleum evansii]|uniref:hypothetical protein n=1 Tax=Aromatoleum evansii TaxID=59406 RepID=UPI00145CD273|nr:hypothetical protein [Aromatoleum evansii]NMG29650.1 hypothetical protein [Aromatoleum evansii]